MINPGAQKWTGASPPVHGDGAERPVITTGLAQTGAGAGGEQSSPAPDKLGKREKKAHIWERDEHDWYVEPEWATRGLLQVEGFVGSIWDPACGAGNVLKAIDASTLVPEFIYGSDVVDRGAPFFHRVIDFLAYEGPALAPNIITNPPYFRAAGTEAFIRKSLMLARGKVAVFASIGFLAGGKRSANLYTEHPPSRVWSISPRPSCPTGSFLESGGKAKDGQDDYVWLVWDMTAPPCGTRFLWLRCEP